jgi:two-component sensor histidine kinase
MEPDEREPMRILIIDDIGDDRLLARREVMQEFPAAQVVEVGAPSAFEAALADGPYDLAITDFALQWSDGLTVLRRLREGTPDLPVIMYTASGNEQIAVDAMKAGVNDYVVKSPRHLVRLRLSVRAVMDGAAIRRQALESERALRAALREKELLIEELYHRVNNNLQLVSTFVERAARVSADPETRLALQDTLARIQAIALVQEQLYRSGNYAEIDFAAHLRQLLRVHMAGTDVRGTAQLDPLVLPIDRAIPLALIVNELIQNAFKHAVPLSPELMLLLTVDGAAATVELRDRGPGLRAGRAGRTGLKLVRSLAAQVDASFDLAETGSGVIATLRFPIEDSPQDPR